MSAITCVYDETTGSLILTVPIEGITAPSESKEGVPSAHAMICSSRAYNDFDCVTPFGPVRGNVNIGVLVGDLPDTVAAAIGVDKVEHAAKLLAAGQSVTRRGGGGRASIALADIKPANKPDPVAALAAARAKAQRK